jgi:hypothetical protein
MNNEERKIDGAPVAATPAVLESLVTEDQGCTEVVVEECVEEEEVVIQ